MVIKKHHKEKSEDKWHAGKMFATYHKGLISLIYKGFLKYFLKRK